MITPDPFEGQELPIEVSARELANRTFRSAAEAQEAFATARRIVVNGVATGR
jgi:hypothetical protein